MVYLLTQASPFHKRKLTSISFPLSPLEAQIDVKCHFEVSTNIQLTSLFICNYLKEREHLLQAVQQHIF